MNLGETETKQLIKFGYNHVEETIDKETAPKVTANIFEYAMDFINDDDPYKEEKEYSNKAAMEVIDKLELEKEIQGVSGFENAIKLSIAGNIIDYSAFDDVDDEKIYSTIKRVLEADFKSAKVTELQSDLKNAKKIMYIADNAGEIVFDKLLLSKMDLSKVTFVIKSGPIVNDATLSDCEMVGIDQLVKVIDNGAAIQGCDLNYCSKEFIEEFNSSDLIISKGQANFETLDEINDKNIYFLLMAKCRKIASCIGCEVGDFVLMRNN